MKTACFARASECLQSATTLPSRDQREWLCLPPRIPRRMFLCAPALAVSARPLLSDGRVHSVCSILKNLNKLNSHLIRIRGTVHSSLEDYSLRDSCDFHLTTGTYIWPSAIWLTGATPVKYRNHCPMPIC
jgi:hypothetical protein